MDFNSNLLSTNQRDFIRYENVFDNKTLESLEKFCKQNKPINNIGESTSSNSNIRKITSINMSESPPNFIRLLQDSLIYANNIFNFNLNYINLHYAEYIGGKSELNWHLDIGKYPFNIRKLSFTINVNNEKEYKGGDLEFFTSYKSTLISSSNQGGITIFPSFLLHRVTPITEGIRKVIIGFVEGPPYK